MRALAEYPGGRRTWTSDSWCGLTLVLLVRLVVVKYRRTPLPVVGVRLYFTTIITKQTYQY